MSQTSEMGAMLLAARGEWVSMTEIGKVIGAWAVHSRAADLRRQGHAIENRIEVGKDGQKHSYYRLIAHPTAKAAGRHHSAAPVAGVPLAGTQCDQESFEWEAFDGDGRGGIPD